MLKSEVIEELGARNKITASEAEQFLNSLIRLIYEKTSQGETVVLHGFGKFLTSHRKPRMGVTPRAPYTPLLLPEFRTPKFKAGEAFKEAVRLGK